MKTIENFKVRVPEGKSGKFTIERFTISEERSRLAAMQAAFSGNARFPDPGRYTRLLEGAVVWMSDTRDEVRDHSFAISKAQGRVLIHGLGIGLVVRACLKKPEVEHVMVVEKSTDVIALAGPHYRRMGGKRIEIIHGDALTWDLPKGARWEMVWHDIWPSICVTNLDEIATLKRRFARRASWQGAWCEAQARMMRERDRRSYW